MSALRGQVVELHRRRRDEVLQRSRNGADSGLVPSTRLFTI